MGFVAVAVLQPLLRRRWRMTEDETVQKGLYSLFGAGGFAPGNLGHSFADMPGADAFEAIERRFRR